MPDPTVSKGYRGSQTHTAKRKAWVTLGFFFMVCLGAYSQHKTRVDSLDAVYSSGRYPKQDQLKILKELAINHPDTERKLFFSEALIRAAQALDSTDYLVQGYQEKGNALRLKSDLSNALESYFQGAKLVGESTQSSRLGSLYIGIGDVYAIMGNHKNGIKYHDSAIRILRAAGDSVNVANALLNTGDEYITIHKWDSALIYTEEAGVIFENLHYAAGEAYSLGNLGMIYAQMGNYRKAEENMNKAITLLEGMNDYYPIAVYLTLIADIYLVNGDTRTALAYAFKSLELARRYGLKDQISAANLKLSQVYEKIGNTAESFRYYKSHIAYKDSVKNVSSVQEMADLRTDFEISKKQIEVDLLNQQKKNQQIIVAATAAALVMICLLAFGVYRRYRFIRETNQVIKKEQERSETLLLNILPKETALELKQSGRVQAKRFEAVTVLFADFKGFTQYAEKLSPEKLVESIDFYFSRFDTIMEAHGLEKIKTIGDAYMCAAGLPFPTADHAHNMVRAALDIAAFVHETNQAQAGAQPFSIRIGINSGAVVAGVVGTKKFAYDIWGDTVNIAARMESNSEPGRINISENTHALIKDAFDCTYRGEIEVKNKGMMKMYFVNGTHGKMAQ